MKIIFVKEIELFDDSLIRPILKKSMKEGAEITIHYRGCNQLTWVGPQIITKKLIEDILDHSIDQIKILEEVKPCF